MHLNIHADDQAKQESSHLELEISTATILWYEHSSGVG